MGSCFISPQLFTYSNGISAKGDLSGERSGEVSSPSETEEKDFLMSDILRLGCTKERSLSELKRGVFAETQLLSELFPSKEDLLLIWDLT